jgi:predicted metal-dependent hydrolase
VRLSLILWFKKRARVKLQKRMDFWSRQTGMSYAKLVISNPRHRWGSCNVHNVIRLNWQLLLAPLALIDYVIVHELCHTVHKNHGPRFWKKVADTLPDYQARRKELRKSGSRFRL